MLTTIIKTPTAQSENFMLRWPHQAEAVSIANNLLDTVLRAAEAAQDIGVKTYNLQDRFVLGQGEHTQPVSKVFQQCSV